MKLNHSLCGSSAVGFLEVMLVSALRRYYGLYKSHDIYSIAHPIQCDNLFRVIDHYMDKYKISYESLDKKEDQVMEDLYLLSSSDEFIAAVKNNDIERCKQVILV